MVKDATALKVEKSLTALEEGKDLSLEAEKDILLVPLVPGAGLPLEAEDYTLQVTVLKLLEAICCFALKVVQAADRDPRIGVTHAHGVGATHDLGAGIIPVPEVKQNILDLGVDCLAQCLGVWPGKIYLMIQTTIK